jgi:DNA-binding MarR family transcriptional regulator
MADTGHLNGEGIAGVLQHLLAEVLALAAQLKKQRTPAGGEHVVPQGARGVLQVLADLGPKTVPAIARARGHSRQSVQVLVNRLAGLGWVELTSNPAHKRSALVRLTLRGEGLRAEASEEELANLESRLGRISASGVTRAGAVLRQIRCALAESDPELGSLASVSTDPKLPAAVTESVEGSRDVASKPQDAAELVRMRPPRRRRRDPVAFEAAMAEQDPQQAEEFPVSLL